MKHKYDVDDIELILTDMYFTDAELPPLTKKWRTEFEWASYSRWTCTELLETYRQEFTRASIEDYIFVTKEFLQTMRRFQRVNIRHANIFIIAEQVTSNVLDILEGMR